MSALGAFLAQAMAARGTNASALAKAIGIDRAYLYGIVDGRRPLPPKYVQAAADALGLAGADRYRLVALAALAYVPDDLCAQLAAAQRASGSAEIPTSWLQAPSERRERRARRRRERPDA